MIKIYRETKRANYREPFKRVTAYYEDEVLGMPAMVHVEKGHCDTATMNDKTDSDQWLMIQPKPGEIPHECHVIRETIQIMDGE